jgi:hypothetical protein
MTQPESTVHTQLLLAKLDTITARLDTFDARSQQRTPTTEREPWWATVTKFLGLPAAAIALLLNVTTVRHDSYETDKLAAETSKIKTDELKTRADLAQQLDALDKSRAAGTAAYRAELEATLPKIEDSLARLRVLNESARLTDTSVLYKSLIVATFISTVWLMISVLSTVWGSLSTLIFVSVYQTTERANDRGKRFQWFEKWKGRLPLIVGIWSSFWSIGRKWLEVFLFLALTIPLFNLATHALGSSLTLQDVSQDLIHLRLTEALDKIRDVLSRP